MHRIVTQQGNKVPIGGILADGDGCNLCCLGQGSRPSNVQIAIQLGDAQCLTFQPKPAGRVFGSLRSDFLFERWVFGPFGKEIRESALHVPVFFSTPNMADVVL